MRKDRHQKLQLWISRVDRTIKKCHSLSFYSAVVKKVTERESGSAHGLVSQGRSGKNGETPV